PLRTHRCRGALHPSCARSATAALRVAFPPPGVGWPVAAKIRGFRGDRKANAAPAGPGSLRQACCVRPPGQLSCRSSPSEEDRIMVQYGWEFARGRGRRRGAPPPGPGRRRAPSPRREPRPGPRYDREYEAGGERYEPWWGGGPGYTGGYGYEYRTHRES